LAGVRAAGADLPFADGPGFAPPLTAGAVLLVAGFAGAGAFDLLEVGFLIAMVEKIIAQVV
jgi:hypothetical protein